MELSPRAIRLRKMFRLILLDSLVLETVQVNDLWMQDRNFCTCAFLCEIDRRGAGLITRQHEGLPFETVNVRRSVSRIETGHVAEQRVQVRDAQGGTHLFRDVSG